MIGLFSDQRIVVMGLGRFGGGAGVTRWLARQGARVLLTDQQPPERLTSSLDELRDLIDHGIVELRLGEHRAADFTSADGINVNPAVPHPWDNPYLCAASEHGVPLTTEIRLVTSLLRRERVIGVTGTAGKSTTAAMIHHMLHAAGARSHLGGNIGGSLLDTIDQIDADDWIVLELSSAMLYWLGEGIGHKGVRGWSPHIAACTNIKPNHLDWHGSFEHYRTCKQGLYRYQEDGDHRIDEKDVLRGPFLPLAIPGHHNQHNAQLAMASVCRAIDIDPSSAVTLLSDFAGLPHRLQLVHEVDGMRFYNDSKSTTPAATVLAVQALDDPSRIHLIAGGYDKGIDLSPIAESASRIARLYAIGAVGDALAMAAEVHGASAVSRCGTLERAVDDATGRMGPGDILLLSPGCASWDQFSNYEQRGDMFSGLVRRKAAAHV